jgi:aminobenzoyl-glutamate transport protein
MAAAHAGKKRSVPDRILDFIEKSGNILPDPAMMFFLCLVAVWLLSLLLAPVQWSEIDPRTGEALRVVNQLDGANLVDFLAKLVNTFVTFVPLGVVLVAVLGVGVAEQSGLVDTGLKFVLRFTPKSLLTPALVLVGILSHNALDAGYVVLVPLGAVIFHAAGRHPIAGLVAANAGVAGGFSANLVPSALDAMLQGFTQSAARLIDPAAEVNILANYFFTTASVGLVIAVCWYITDRIIEPRLSGTALNEDVESDSQSQAVGKMEARAFLYAGLSVLLLVLLLVLAVLPASSPFRDSSGALTSYSAPLMRSIVPLIFVIFLVPGMVYGFAVRKYTRAKDVVDAMTESMRGMSYYVVIAFFAALFIDAFGRSNLGALIALKGAGLFQSLAVPPELTVVGIILLTGVVNMFVGSSSAKWALLAPIFVPMLMQLGISPEMTQAAYRVGDSSTNIITPLSPYLPLFVVFAQRYVRDTGIGTIISLSFPYAVTLILLWTLLLLAFWAVGVPIGIEASFVYPAQ